MENNDFDFKKYEKISNKSRYERRLAELKNQKKETQNIEEVVSYSIKNLKEGTKSFIIYGDPQCGKTEMMIALTAKLLDEGNKVIIVLVTDNISLLKQNLDRFRISGIDPSPKNFSEILDDNIKIGDSNWVIFSKKNASNLKKLKEKLKDVNNKVIIDDEADYATPNSKINMQEKSKINQLTGDLIGDGVYIGVTATPARLDLNNTHNNQTQKWARFRPHSNYTGQEIFFPIESENIKYKLVFLPDDNPQFIVNALFSFMINVAHLNLKINSQGEKNYSFLVHTSGRTLDHSRDYQQIVKTFSNLSDKSNPDREKYYKKIWEMAKESFSGEEDEIVSYIIENNQRNNIAVMNSNRDFNRDSASVIDPSTLFTVIVGGNIISRGVTFNNLLSMFFTRGVKNKFHQDTYIQRARMFGSRGEYLKYFELFIPEDLYLNWHNCFILHKLSLESINSTNGPPVWIYDDKIAVTSGSSIDKSSVRLEGGEIGFAIFDFNDGVKKVINENEISNIGKLEKLHSVVGESSLPEFLLKYVKNNNSKEESIKLYKPLCPKWKDVDMKSLKRAKGFISTSSKNFKDFSHHIQIIHNNDNQARIYYKPSNSKLGFMKNVKLEKQIN